jgi:hypothetical protein
VGGKTRFCSSGLKFLFLFPFPHFPLQKKPSTNHLSPVDIRYTLQRESSISQRKRKKGTKRGGKGGEYGGGIYDALWCSIKTNRALKRHYYAWRGKVSVLLWCGVGMMITRVVRGGVTCLSAVSIVSIYRIKFVPPHPGGGLFCFAFGFILSALPRCYRTVRVLGFTSSRALCSAGDSTRFI